MGSDAGAIRIGISGWRYPPWRGVFYPNGLAQRRELEFASRALSTIELNGSFYSLQRPESYASWYADTPDDFIFSVKGPRFVTHILRLRDTDTAIANFLASGVANFRDKLGPLLWQFAPTFRYDEALLDYFLAGLPRDTDDASTLACSHDERVAGRVELDFGPNRRLRHAVEIRHDSFVEPSFIALLRRHNVALVIADTGAKFPQFEDVTADFIYIRLHGAEELYVSGYADETIAHWARRIRRWSEGREPDDARKIAPDIEPSREPRDVFCYFDNTAKEEAPRNARDLQRVLDAAHARTDDNAGRT